MNGYRITDHTADLGMILEGRSAPALFTLAARALFEQIVAPGTVEDRQRRRLTVEGTDWTDLMIVWLRELLYLWQGHRLLVGEVEITDLTPTGLRADLSCDRYDPRRHEILAEIKAVTYHRARVEGGAGEWRGEVVFDV